MLQSHIIEVDGVFVGAAIRIDRGRLPPGRTGLVRLAYAGGRPPPGAPDPAGRQVGRSDFSGAPRAAPSCDREGSLRVVVQPRDG